MIRRVLLEVAQLPGDAGELRLYQHGTQFVITVDNLELMNSRVHGSEDALAEQACRRVKKRAQPRVLIGGLGMGFTLGAALRELGPTSQVVVAELIPAVMAWNRGPLAPLAGHPLDDGRVLLCKVDVAEIIRAEKRAYDAIILDVDNGPDGLTCIGNDWLYSLTGLSAALVALRPGGVLAVWSAAQDRAFAKRLRMTGFAVEEIRARASGGRKGARHTLWIAKSGT